MNGDDEILKDIFNERDVDLIKKIPVPVLDRQDSWFWLLDDKGIFTVKSCYRKLHGYQSTPQTSFWRRLWSIKLPGKVVNFLWRACSSCLPTAVDLITKRVHLDAKCQWCRTDDEDALHVLFKCSFAKAVWLTGGLQDLILVHQHHRVFDVLQRVFDIGTSDQIVLISLLCWNLWNRRNKWVWDKVNMSIFGVRTGHESVN